jgi:glycosyltransferase involved in cell wall biosynthesis
VRVLYVLGDVPAAGTGGHTRTAGTVRALARSAAVDVIYPDRPALAADERLADHGKVRLVPVHGRGRAGRAAVATTLLAAGRPLALARSVKPALRAALAQQVRERPPDVVVADQLSAALTCVLAGVPAAVPRSIYNANNIEWELRRSVGLLERLSWLGTRRLERDVLRAFDESWMVSEQDAEVARALVPEAAIRVVPNAVDVSAIQPVRQSSKPVVLFVGSFDYAPNRIGLEWLTRRVMPAVWRERPDAHLDVVGRWHTHWHPPDGRVRVRGFVPDLAEAYATARCAVAPLVAGGGTPLKVIEALAYGLPLVATPLAVQGLSALEPGRHVHVAGRPEEFASALLRLLDPSHDAGPLTAAARAQVERSYSLDAVAGAVAGGLCP